MPGADVAAGLCAQHGDGAVLPLVRTEDVEVPAGTADLLGTVRSHEDTGAAGAAAPATSSAARRTTCRPPRRTSAETRSPPHGYTATATSPTPRSRIPLLTASPDEPRADRTTRPTSV
ncbi:hypothetical protein AB0I51_45480 [Streptomyces sp. NPDC050549]|uniref:hypothetical protein n=1 Tax=Streptomyces sp. NPDC050549 TaxID=3155406 RepID=UPI003417BA4C